MSEARRRAYLEALDLDVWLPKARAGQPLGLVVSGAGRILLVCASSEESAGRLAGDITRALGGDVAWGWPDPGEGADTLAPADAVGQYMFTGILLFGEPAEKQLFTGPAPAVLGSARVLRAPALDELAVRGTAKQALWELLKDTVHERQS